jgi:hypothetical protein
MKEPKVSWDYELGFEEGAEDELKRIQKYLQAYFDMTQEPEEQGLIEKNPEWDRGFQAAMALVMNPYNKRSPK